MTNVIISDDLWDGDDEEAVLVIWYYDDGASVVEGDLIADIMVSKVQIEIKSPASGKLFRKVAPEEIVKKNMVIATVT